MARSELTLDRVFIEVRFPRRLAFIDHVGRLADGFEETFDDAQVTATEVRLSAGDHADLVLTPERVLVRHQLGDRDWALAQLTSAVAHFGKVVGLESVDYVGARQVFLYEVGTVSDATTLFRSVFFDYRQQPMAAFGTDPLEAQAWIAYRLSDGVCRLIATAISRQPGDTEIPLDEEPSGALLLDVDRSNDLGIEGWTAAEVAESLLTDGYARAVDFVGGLKLPPEKADTGRA